MGANRISQKPLFLIIMNRQNRLMTKKGSMEMIEKFKKYGVIKKFEIVMFGF